MSNYGFELLMTALPGEAEVVYSADVQDSELNRRLKEINDKLAQLASTKTGEPLVGSEFDNRLIRISDSLSGLDKHVSSLTSKVDSHIRFGWVCIATLFGLCATGAGVIYHQNGRLTHIEDSVPSAQIQSASYGPLNAAKLKRVQEIVKRAKSNGAGINPRVVSQLGRHLIQETSENPQLAKGCCKTPGLTS